MRKSILETAVGIASLAGFFVLTVLVVSGVSQSVDLQIALAVNHYDFGSLGTGLMVLLTTYGREIVWGLLVALMFLFGRDRKSVV